MSYILIYNQNFNIFLLTITGLVSDRDATGSEIKINNKSF